MRRLAVLLDADEGGAAAAARRLKLSVADRDRVTDLAGTWRSPPDATSAAAIRHALYRLGRDRFVDAALAQWAGTDAAEPWTAALTVAAAWEPPRFPLSGKDVQALGVEPGPKIGQALRAVEEWWIDGDFESDRAACLARLRDVVSAQ